jgi:hypothetical protein
MRSLNEHTLATPGSLKGRYLCGRTALCAVDRCPRWMAISSTSLPGRSTMIPDFGRDDSIFVDLKASWFDITDTLPRFATK